MANSKSLIAYFSRTGNNYVGGSILKLTIGNTEVVAKEIQALTDSDIFQIKTVKSYPEDYTEATKVAQVEKRENARPELTETIEDIGVYGVIYLGYPSWWGTMPMAVFTFLDSYDFSGKTIVPFCTHEGSALGRSVADIKKLCPKSTVLDGIAVKGSTVNDAQNEVHEWLSKIGLID
jgi:flavodoxin